MELAGKGGSLVNVYWRYGLSGRVLCYADVLFCIFYGVGMNLNAVFAAARDIVQKDASFRSIENANEQIYIYSQVSGFLCFSYLCFGF